MSEHYNAFISYRHAPLDTKVAEEIQKQLERFKIPKSIGKTTGIKKIDRIFRDKEELPITNNLSATIENALNHSDYLIVICSHAMLESVWVQREINFFLKTHSKKQILTVIAEGEPTDVIPDILKYDEMELPTESGDMELVQVPAEPLSCDYRLPFKKARKEELPRLAAALIGCSYDGLRQRQRQYKRHRIIAACTALGITLTGLTGYYAWTSIQIQANYEQALRNQSAYLAAESNSLLDSGDRISAMLLALEALPSEGSDRPVIPEAINALVRSSNAYQSPGSNKIILDTSFSHTGSIDDFQVSTDESTLFVWHSKNMLSFWDIETHTEFFTKTYDSSLYGMFVTSEDNVFVWNYTTIEYLDGKTGDIIWSEATSAFSAIMSENTNAIGIKLGTAKSDASWDKFYAYETENNPDFVTEETSYLNYIYLIDCLTGEIMASTSANITINDQNCYLTPLCLSDDNNYMALYTTCENAIQLIIWNIQENTITCIPTEYEEIDHAIFTEDNTVIFACPGGSDHNNLGGGRSFKYINKGTTYDILSKAKMDLVCMNTSCEALWTQELWYSQLYNGTFLNTAIYNNGEISIPVIIGSVGNRSCIYNLQTGELLDEIETSAPIIAVQPDTTNYNKINFLLSNGKQCGYLYADQFYAELSYIVDSLSMGFWDEHCYVVQEDSNLLLMYSYDLYDENWQELTTLASVNNTIQTEYGLLIFDYLNGDTDKTHAVFATDAGILWENNLDRNDSNYTYLGLWQDKLAFLYEGRTEDYLSYYELELWDPKTGEIEKIDMNEEFLSSNGCIKNGQLIKSYYYDENGLCHSNGITILNLETNETSYCTFSSDYSCYKLYANEAGNSFVIYDYSGQYLLVTKDTETLLGDPVDNYATTCTWSDDSKYFAISSTSEVRLYHQDGSEYITIPCYGRNPIAFKFYEDTVLIAFDNNTLRRYQISDGTFLSETSIGIGTYLNKRNVWYTDGDGNLWVLFDDYLNIIDTDTWKLETMIENCIGFMADTKQIFVIGWDKGSDYLLGLYKLYSTEELITRAQGMLNGSELTLEQKAEYGISS